MKDYKVLEDFIDKESGKLLKEGDIVKLTAKRVKEINSAYKDVVFVEEVKKETSAKKKKG